MRIYDNMNTVKKCAAKEKILEAAKELFGKFGYDKTTLEGICRKTGKAKTSIYYYYDGKRALLKDIVEREFAQMKENLEMLITIDEHLTSAQIRAYLKERINQILSMQVYPQFIINHYSGAEDEACELVRCIREDFDRWERSEFCEICREGKHHGILTDAVQPDAFADMIQMLLKGIENQLVITPEKQIVVDTYDAMVDFLIRDCNESCRNETEQNNYA